MKEQTWLNLTHTVNTPQIRVSDQRTRHEKQFTCYANFCSFITLQWQRDDIDICQHITLGIAFLSCRNIHWFTVLSIVFVTDKGEFQNLQSNCEGEFSWTEDLAASTRRCHVRKCLGQSASAQTIPNTSKGEKVSARTISHCLPHWILQLGIRWKLYCLAKIFLISVYSAPLKTHITWVDMYTSFLQTSPQEIKT